MDMHIAPSPLPFFFWSFWSLLIHPLLLLFSAHGIDILIQEFFSWIYRSKISILIIYFTELNIYDGFTSVFQLLWSKVLNLTDILQNYLLDVIQCVVVNTNKYTFNQYLHIPNLYAPAMMYYVITKFLAFSSFRIRTWHYLDISPWHRDLKKHQAHKPKQNSGGYLKKSTLTLVFLHQSMIQILL